jgi:hypothetical protein
LDSDIAGDKLAGAGIQRQLSGDIHKSAAHDGLRVRADRLRSLLGSDNPLAHRFPPVKLV